MEKPLLVALDLESVLIPEIWQAIAAATGVRELQRTTRDEPDYDALMRGRIALLRQHALTLARLQEIIAAMHPLDGAVEFLDWLRARAQAVILSDTFYEFARPLLAQIGNPALFCHTLAVDGGGFITGYRQRCPDSKRAAALAFRALGFRTAAVADSHNDLGMLSGVDHGFWFRPDPALAQQHPGYPVCQSYAELQTILGGLAA